MLKSTLDWVHIACSYPSSDLKRQAYASEEPLWEISIKCWFGFIIFRFKFRRLKAAILFTSETKAGIFSDESISAANIWTLTPLNCIALDWVNLSSVMGFLLRIFCGGSDV